MTDIKPFEELSADHLRLILNTGHIGIWELDIASGFASRNRYHDQIFGYSDPLKEWTFEQFISHVVTDDRQRVADLQQAAIAAGEEWAFQCAIITATGDKRWISAAGRPLLNNDGTTHKLIGYVIDISETKEREARLSLLTEELNHRVRNMLSVIKSIVRLSSRKAETIGGFAKALEGRVASLARSHSLLVDDSSALLKPSEILELELAVIPNLENRVDVTADEDRFISAAAGQGLALVFHELITNALKYGALSNETGRVIVSILDRDGALEVHWRETGGPPVIPPEESGFGTTLIAEAMGPRASIDLRFPDTGVECDIVIETR